MKNPFSKININYHILLFNNEDWNMSPEYFKKFLFKEFNYIVESKSDFVKMIGDDNLKLLTEQMKVDSEYLKRKQNDINFSGLRDDFDIINNFVYEPI